MKLSTILFTLLLAFYFIDAQVIELTSQNFDEKVTQSEGIWIVAFIAPWCGHCQRLKPEYESAAEALGGVVNLGRVNCDNERDLAQRFDIRGFPTIKVFNAGRYSKSSPDDYHGPRSAKAISDYAISLLNSQPDTVKKLQTKEDLDSFDDEAGPKAILFSTKSSTPPLFKSLALELKGKMLFALADSSLMDYFGVDAAPKVVLLPEKKEGDEEKTYKERSQLYDGKLKKYELLNFLSSHAKEVIKPKPKEAPPVKPKELKQENIEKECEKMCIIGCLNGKDDQTFFESLATKYRKHDTLNFVYVDMNNNKEFCKAFGLNVEKSPHLIVLRYKKHKYATKENISKESEQFFFEDVLYGGIRFKNIENIPKLEEQKDEL